VKGGNSKGRVHTQNKTENIMSPNNGTSSHDNTNRTLLNSSLGVLLILITKNMSRAAKSNDKIDPKIKLLNVKVSPEEYE